ncbi:MAG: hypothetical protein HY975_02600 [Candidatus Kerfeldbacteria bacterium]|nr:hypothetical protein [Candidatus Kerfeldbacteria bacterium]
MRRSTLILVIVLAAVVIGGAVYLWVNRDWLSLPGTTNTTTTTNTVTNIATATNTPAETITAPVNAQGNTPVSGKINVAGTDITVSSLQRYDTYQGATAEKGMVYLQVYIEPVAPAVVTAVSRALLADTRVLDTKTSYPAQTVKVSSTLSKNDRGFLIFQVPVAAKNLKLEYGSGPSAQHLDLP